MATWWTGNERLHQNEYFQYRLCRDMMITQIHICCKKYWHWRRVMLHGNWPKCCGLGFWSCRTPCMCLGLIPIWNWNQSHNLEPLLRLYLDHCRIPDMAIAAYPHHQHDVKQQPMNSSAMVTQERDCGCRTHSVPGLKPHVTLMEDSKDWERNINEKQLACGILTSSGTLGD